MKVMVIGSGGREHAISWKLAQSPLVQEVICVPGNGGTFFEAKCRNIAPGTHPATAGLSKLEAYAAIAKAEQCDFAVVGPEDPLAEGVADMLWKSAIPTVGPCKAAAQLEASKDTAKQFMQKYGVACAKSSTCTSAEEAHAYIDKNSAPIVIKADGLAAGKGVVVAATVEEAHQAVDNFMTKGTLGAAGSRLVMEEYLKGVEISVLAAVSVTPELAAGGKAAIVPFTPARDHKRLMDGAKGPNTGGMGAVSPLPDVTADDMARFQSDILEPTLRGLIAEGFDYRGFIFFGIMLTKDGPKLLEYNVRLGDPETQAVLPLMDFDFAALCQAVTTGTLKEFPVAWKQGFVCAPVVVSGGYPGSYKKGCPLTVDTAVFEANQAKLFVAGAVVADTGADGALGGAKTGAALGGTVVAEATGKTLVTSGGRVLAASAFGATFGEAWNNAYAAVKGVQFEDMFYRKDIGLPGAAESN